jgi:uncharacterized protein (TIGR02391 family)
LGNKNLIAKRLQNSSPLEPRQFHSPEEIDRGIGKLERRIQELEKLDLGLTVRGEMGTLTVARSNVRESIRAVFGTNSPEFKEHEHLDIWAGPHKIKMPPGEILMARSRGCKKVVDTLKGLIGNLREKREEVAGGTLPSPSTYFDRLNLHPRILDVSRALFLDGHHWEAVFAAGKALVNYVKEKSGRHDLDGGPLMRAVFSRNDSILAFNDLSSQTDFDEQEGMMHLFEGAVLDIRNPGEHSFPEGTEQRASEHISLLSLLAYRVQETKRRKSS